MNYGETAYARPIGVSSMEPREEYRPSKIYRRGEESPFSRQVAVPKPEQKSVVENPESAASKPEQPGIIDKPEIVSKKTEQKGIVDKPEMALPKAEKASVDNPSGFSYREGAYTDRIIAAVRDGHQTTTDIVSVTGIPRKAAVKTIGRLVIKGRLKNLPDPAGLPKGDRCVALRDKPVVMDRSLSPIAKLQLLMNEHAHIQASFASMHDQMEALKKQIDAIFDALPDLHGAVEALEKARKSEEVLASIVNTVRSLDSD